MCGQTNVLNKEIEMPERLQEPTRLGAQVWATHDDYTEDPVPLLWVRTAPSYNDDDAVWFSVEVGDYASWEELLRPVLVFEGPEPPAPQEPGLGAVVRAYVTLGEDAGAAAGEERVLIFFKDQADGPYQWYSEMLAGDVGGITHISRAWRELRNVEILFEGVGA